jgi:hypothetical protein
MFALWMTFGVPSLLFTFSPCDECSFKMELYASAGEPITLPSIHEPMETLFQKLGCQKSLRVKRPRACALEFDSLLQIVIKHLVGWGKKGVQRNFWENISSCTSFRRAGKDHPSWSYHTLDQQVFYVTTTIVFKGYLYQESSFTRIGKIFGKK